MIFPPVADPRSPAEQAFDAFRAAEKARELDRQRPAVQSVMGVLRMRIPAFRDLDEDDQYSIASTAVSAVEAGW